MTITLFLFLLVLFIVERMVEIRIANRNVRELRSHAGKEFGAEHYPVIVLMHTGFFISLILEFFLRGMPLAPYFIVPMTFLAAAQALRFWVLHTMRGRWTTRIIAVPGEALITTGPFRFLSHPNYVAVALEIASLPLIFNLVVTCIAFSLLNAVVLLAIRIPCERRALQWSQEMFTG